MEQVTWNEIRDVAILPEANDLKTSYRELSWKKDWETEVSKAYETHRMYMHSRMRRPKPGSEVRIDRHKVGAALAKAILDVRPLEHHSSNPSEGARLANEILAFEASLSIVVSFGAEEAATQGDLLLKKAYESEFVLPTSADGPYEEHMHFGLRHATYVKHGQFDEFLFANLLFVLEAFHLASIIPGLQLAEAA